MAAPRASIAVNVTRAGLTVATAFALTRVFAGRSWLLLMLLAAIAPPVCLEWTRRHQAHPVLRLAAVGVVGVWLSALVADPSTSVLGVPTRATLVELGHELTRAPHTLRAAVVPVSPTAAALVLAFVGVFVAAALTYWIATSLDAPFGAFAPSIALFIVIAAIGSGGWVAPTALYALASLGYLLALAQHDLAIRRTWFHAGRPRESRVAAGGIIVGAVAVAAALIAGPSVPGAGGSPLFDYQHALGASDTEGSLLSAPPPILAIRDKLTLGEVTELFTVSAPRAAYWRVIALDWFTNDNAWGVNKATEQSASKLRRPADLPRSTPMHQQFHIKTLDPHWLPAAYQPVGINLTAARVVPDSLTLLVDSRSHLRDLVYDVDSEIPTPTPATLSRARDLTPRDLRQNLELPSDFPAPVRALARTVTQNARNNYERAAALQQYFRGGEFTYTTDTDLGDSPDAITQFLLKTKAGFCEQFAASFAAMARAVGVPSRVAVGYQPGELGGDGLYHVTNRNAHAWPEVWLAGVGWIPFEPTPGFSEPTLGIGTGGPAKAGQPNATGTGTTQPGGTTAPASPPTIGRTPNLNVETPTPVATSSHHARTAWTIVGIVVAVLAFAVVVFVAAVAFTLWQRRRRRRHDADPRRRVLGVWAEALDQLRTAGVPPRPSATALEFALRYAPAHGAGEAGPALMELAHLQSAAMYASEAPSEAQATVAWEQVDTIRDTIRHNVARTRRWRRIVRYRSP